MIQLDVLNIDGAFKMFACFTKRAGETSRFGEVIFDDVGFLEFKEITAFANPTNCTDAYCSRLDKLESKGARTVNSFNGQYIAVSSPVSFTKFRHEAGDVFEPFKTMLSIEFFRLCAEGMSGKPDTFSLASVASKRARILRETPLMSASETMWGTW